MFPDRRARAPKTAIVITARTTPYSAIVCPSSRRGNSASRRRIVCTSFTSFLAVGVCEPKEAIPDRGRSEKRETISVSGKPPSRCSVRPLHRFARWDWKSAGVSAGAIPHDRDSSLSARSVRSPRAGRADPPRRDRAPLRSSRRRGDGRGRQSDRSQGPPAHGQSPPSREAGHAPQCPR
jgi:hypothetical protein